MKPLPGSPIVSPTTSVFCFWCGALLLLALTMGWRGAVARARSVNRQWNALDALLAQRRQRLAALFPRDGAIADACRGAEMARSNEDRLAAERAIDDRLHTYLSGSAHGLRAFHAALAPGTRPDDAQAELADWSGHITVAATHYNEAALGLNAARRSFPAALLLRARTEGDLPLYER